MHKLNLQLSKLHLPGAVFEKDLAVINLFQAPEQYLYLNIPAFRKLPNVKTIGRKYNIVSRASKKLKSRGYFSNRSGFLDHYHRKPRIMTNIEK